MISKFVKGKVSIFIDASNVYYSQNKLKWRIDFRKFLNYLKKETDLRGIYYYTARDLSFEKQTRFLNFLEMIGYKVRSKKIKFIKDKSWLHSSHRSGTVEPERKWSADGLHSPAGTMEPTAKRKRRIFQRQLGC